MSSILDLVQQSLGGDAVQALSQRLGADPAQTQSAIQAALPMLLAGIAHNAQGANAGAVHAAVGQHDGGLLDDLSGFLGGAGGGSPLGTLLQQVLGQHHDEAHAAVAGASGLGGAQTSQLLAMLAPVVLSAMARSTQGQGLDAGGLAAMLRGEHQQVAQSVAQGQPGLLGLAGQLLGQQPGGNVLGDLTKGLGGLLGGR